MCKRLTLSSCISSTPSPQTSQPYNLGHILEQLCAICENEDNLLGLLGGFKDSHLGTYPGGPVVDSVLPVQRVQVESLLEGLRSHMPGGQKKKVLIYKAHRPWLGSCDYLVNVSCYFLFHSVNGLRCPHTGAPSGSRSPSLWTGPWSSPNQTP